MVVHKSQSVNCRSRRSISSRARSNPMLVFTLLQIIRRRSPKIMSLWRTTWLNRGINVTQLKRKILVAISATFRTTMTWRVTQRTATRLGLIVQSQISDFASYFKILTSTKMTEWMLWGHVLIKSSIKPRWRSRGWDWTRDLVEKTLLPSIRL